MKKSLLALAAVGALGAFAGAASAQSSVTIYGKLAISAGRDINSDTTTVSDDKVGSRLGFKGTEDLGNGMKANFALEQRFKMHDGTPTNDKDSKGTTVQQTWRGMAYVGLSGGFGAINLGRQYTAAFSLTANTVDPFAGETVAILRDVAMTLKPTPGTALATDRVNSSIRYDYSAKGFNVAANIEPNAQNGASATTAKDTDPGYSVAANYTTGPFFVTAGYETPGTSDADTARPRLWTFGGAFTTANKLRLSLGLSTGKTAADAEVSGWLLGAVMPVGANGSAKVGYATKKTETAAGVSTTDNKRIGVGYEHRLSKRTKLFTDFVHDGADQYKPENGGKATTGWDFGVQHNF